MKVPKYIKEAITKSGRYFKLAHMYNNIVRDWLTENNFIDDYKGNGKNGFDLDSYIDLIEYGVDGSETIIKEIEKLEVDNNG